jgi:hypothetical protein
MPHSDRGGAGLETGALLVAKKMQLPVVIPYLSHISDGLKIREHSVQMQVTRQDSLFKKAVFALFRRWSHSKHGKRLHFYPASELLALWLCKALSRNPWYIGCGLSSILCVDSKRNFERALVEGVSPAKLRIVGHVVNDELYKRYCEREEIAIKLSKKYRLKDGRKIVVMAVPQLAEQGILTWEQHWDEIMFLCLAAEKLGHNLLLSLHPRANTDNYRHIENKVNCVILQERLFDVLPASDLFIATFSSTLVWAVLCGIKSVVVDFYGFGYTDFSDLNTIAVVNDKGQLASALLEGLNAGTDFSEDWLATSRAVVFDGKTTQRYVQILNEAIDG